MKQEEPMDVKEIREHIQEAHDYMTDGMSSYKWQQAYGHICSALALFPALSTIDPEAIKREVCERLTKAVDSVELAESWTDGSFAYNDAVGNCCQAIYDECAAILQAEPGQERPTECEPDGMC